MAAQDLFTKTDTLYKIVSSLDLDGGSVTMPEGCTIDFQGGSISNGTIIGTDTWLTGVPKGSNINYEGTWLGFATKGYVDENLEEIRTSIEEMAYPLNASISGTTLYEYTGSAVTLSANYSIDRSGLAITNLDSVAVTLAGSSVYSATNTSVTNGSVSTTKTDQGSYTWQINVTQGNLSASASFSTRIIAPMYFGFAAASSASSLNVLSLTKQTVKSSVSGTYTLTNSTEGYYMWLCVPSSLTISSVTMDGFSVPMESASTVSTTLGSYKCYRSGNALLAGSYTIVVS